MMATEGKVGRVGQNHIYTVYIQYFWQGNHQIYGHIRCIYRIWFWPTLQKVSKKEVGLIIIQMRADGHLRIAMTTAAAGRVCNDHSYN